MVNELRTKVLERVKDEFKKQYNSFNILQRIEEKQGVFFIHLLSMSTKTWSDEVIISSVISSFLIIFSLLVMSLLATQNPQLSGCESSIFNAI
jgi:hypothetical protein